MSKGRRAGPEKHGCVKKVRPAKCKKFRSRLPPGYLSPREETDGDGCWIRVGMSRLSLALPLRLRAHAPALGSFKVMVCVTLQESEQDLRPGS